MSNLHLKNNYTNKDLKYIKNTIITEYDMESAGMNILTELGYFSEEDRKKLLSMDKLKRNVLIGKMLRKNPKMMEDLEKGFAEARRVFFEVNGIDEYDVVSVKRDAIFIIGYNSYINIMGYENYYNSDTNKLDVKKYSKEVIEVHKDFLLKDLKEILKNSELGLTKENFIKLAVLKDKMVSYNLPKEYYFDIMRSSYLIRGIENVNFSVHNIEEDSVEKGILLYNNNFKFILEVIEQVL